MRRTFMIPEVNEDRMLVKIKQLQKIAKRLDCGIIHCSLVGKKTMKHGDNFINYLEYEVEGETPMLNGYRLVAQLERQTEKNLVSHLDKEVKIPSGLEDRGDFCEHCNSNRRRKYLFILQEEATGTLIQVGKTCVKDFTGGRSNPELIAEWYSHLSELEATQQMSESFTGDGHILYDIKKVIAHSIYIIDQKGYVKSADGTKETPSTVSEVKNLLLSFADNQVRESGCYDKAKEVIDWVIAKKADDYGYFYDLKTLVSERVVGQRKVGIVASAYHVYNKEIAKQAEEAAQRERSNMPDSTFIGRIGERKTYELTFEREHSFESDFGVITIYFFYDENGNMFIWKTGVYLSMEKGDKIMLTGTLKDHNEFNGVKQNILTRCKVAN